MNRCKYLFPLVLSCLWAGPAFAYLDAGTGGALLQIILGGLAGAAVAGKLFWQRIISFFSFARRDAGDDE